MTRTALVPLSIGLAAWSLMALDAHVEALPVPCSPTLWAIPLPVSLKLALVFNSASDLALGWILMIVAMMTPLVVAPLRHVCDRSFARRRVRSMLLFASGYMAVWMAAGAALAALALTLRWAVPDWRLCLALGLVVAVAWQVSPAKQWGLNRCHARPRLAAFGLAADRDALGFGLTYGASCVSACWPLMLLPLVMGHGHIWAMICIALFAFAERLERPSPLAWRWRGPGKALRIAAAQIRLARGRVCERLKPRSSYVLHGLV
jgi:predicted metal-binding membrane protein